MENQLWDQMLNFLFMYYCNIVSLAFCDFHWELENKPKEIRVAVKPCFY